MADGLPFGGQEGECVSVEAVSLCDRSSQRWPGVSVRLSGPGAGFSFCSRMLRRLFVSLGQFSEIKVAYSAVALIRGAKAYR